MANQLFGDEAMEKLKANPETAAILKDPEFSKVIEAIEANPNLLSTYLVSDPRVSKLFSVMAAPSAGGSSTSYGDVKTNVKEASPPENKPVEEDLSELPEEERKKKLALRAKDSGNVAYKKRDFETAIGKYSEAIELDPDNVSFLTNRAAAKLESGDANGCIEDCKEAIKSNSDRSLRTDFKIIARAYGRMGNAHLKLGEFESAIESFQKSLLEYHDPKVQRTLRETERAKERRDAEAYINPDLSKQEREEGNALFKAGKFPESIKKYTESIKRNPKDAAPYSNRAAAYMKLGEFPMAVKDCERCLEIDPNYVKAYIRKGNIHFFMKEYHKCLTDYEQGLKIDPNNRELRQGMMKTQIKIQEQQGSGQVDEARVKQAMQDPEIQAIMQDPQVNNALRQMESDQTFAAKAMRDPALASKLQKLMAAGVLRVA